MFSVNKILVPIIFFVSLFFPFYAHSQQDTISRKERTEIQLKSAEKWYYSKNKHNNAQIIIGDVVFMHDSTTMYCDSALLYKEINTLEAFGKVHVIEDDTINIYGNYLKYNGDTRLLNIKEDVRMVDPSTTLLTDELFFDRVENVAYYMTGAVILNGENELVSKKGYYNTGTNVFIFHEDVVITNPDYVLKSDTLHYNTASKIATAIDTTRIYNKTNTMYCNKGIYNMNDDKGFFNDGVEIFYDTYILYADSLYYDNEIEYAEAFENVIVIDTVNNVTSWSEYLEYSKIDGYAFVSDSSKVRLINESDTAFVFADKIYATFDTTLIDLKCYYNVRLLHRYFQGVCDSAVAYKADSLFKMYIKPVLWSNDNQITGDSIIISTKNENLDKIFVPSNSFIAAQDSLGNFNQIKGEQLYIYFKEKVIDYMDVFGKCKTVYFLQNEDGSEMGTSINSSIDSKIIFEDGNMKNFIFFKDIKSDLYPSDKRDKSLETLDGLQWRGEERPRFDAE